MKSGKEEEGLARDRNEKGKGTGRKRGKGQE
jgi:hypothetical protein